MQIIPAKHQGIMVAQLTIYTFLAFIMGTAAVRQGLSQHYSDIAFRTNSKVAAATAITYQGENPDAHEILGILYLRNKEYAAAVVPLEKAVALRSNDFLLLLRLGYALENSGEHERAETAFRNSLALAPRHSQTNYFLGMMLHGIGDFNEGFLYLSRAAEYEPSLYPEILGLANATFPSDPVALERSMRAQTPAAKSMIASYLIQHDLMTEETRSFLLGDISAEEKNEFARHLLNRRQLSLAREIWRSRADVGSDLGNSLVYDGGFELLSGNDSSGFGWQVDQNADGVSAALDASELHSGSRSFAIRFEGNVSGGRQLLSQLVELRPRSAYRLTYFVRTAELVSAAPPAIFIKESVSNDVLGRSDPIQSTNDKWVESYVDFTVKENSHAVISLQRTPCPTNPCPIFGELFLDDFVLVLR